MFSKVLPAQMTPTQKNFLIIIQYGYKNAEFYADFETAVETVRQKVTGKKLKGLELMPTVLKDEKTTNFAHFYVNFFCRNFLATFSPDLKSASMTFCGKKFLGGHISTLCKLRSYMRTEHFKKRKTF